MAISLLNAFWDDFPTLTALYAWITGLSLLLGAGCLAAKTGYTRAAMCCAASYFVSSTGRTYICVTGYAPTAVQAVTDQALLYNVYANAAFEGTLYPLLASIGYPGATLDTGNTAASVQQ